MRFYKVWFTKLGIFYKTKLINFEFLQYFHTFYHISLQSATIGYAPSLLFKPYKALEVELATVFHDFSGCAVAVADDVEAGLQGGSPDTIG